MLTCRHTNPADQRAERLPAAPQKSGRRERGKCRPPLGSDDQEREFVPGSSILSVPVVLLGINSSGVPTVAVLDERSVMPRGAASGQRPFPRRTTTTGRFTVGSTGREALRTCQRVHALFS